VEKPLWEGPMSPEKLFRLSALLCIVGWGLSAVYAVSHVGSMEEAYVRARDLASYFLSSIWIFVFFYRIVARLRQPGAIDGGRAAC